MISPSRCVQTPGTWMWTNASPAGPVQTSAPKRCPAEYNEGLNKRKAAYVSYAQAVPLKYAIDSDNCIYFQKGKCKACEKFCPTGAINYTQEESERELKVGSVILAAGFKAFEPKDYHWYHYAKFENVVTALEFERILAASGPWMGHLVRPGDEKEPKKIAWLQCVGSRDNEQLRPSVLLGRCAACTR